MSPTPEAQAARERMQKRVSGITAWLIALTVAGGFYLLSVDRANDERDRAQQRTNKQFARALIVTDRKFQQALRIATTQTAYSINKSVCGFRGLIRPALSNAIALRRKYDALAKIEEDRNEATIKRLNAFLETQVTVPSSFACASLPKNPPKGIQ